MKNLFLAAFLILCIACNSMKSRQEIEITFKLNSPDLSPDSAVFIAGNKPQLGNWNPSSVKMKYNGDNSWSYKINLDEPGIIEYKYTLGSWDREAAGANGLPFQNNVARIEESTTLYDDVFFWLDGHRPPFPGKVTGTVKYHQGIKGYGLAERDMVVWLPPAYDDNPEEEYPVLYMHDGQNLFDPATSSFGVDWQVDETCDSLIRNRIIEPIIIVGIYNTSDRTAEYGPGDKGADYMKLVVNTIKPMIDGIYRTRIDQDNTLIGGSSMGGIISFRLVWEYPDIFSKAICMSPAFKIRELDYVQKVKDDLQPKRDIVLYIDNGGVGLEEELQPGIDDMLASLDSKGYVRDKDYFWVRDLEARHFESAWAARMPGALKLLIPVKPE